MYDILEMEIIDYKVKPFIKKAEQMKMLSKVMAYGGRIVRYVNKNTTSPNDKFKISIDPKYEYRNHLYVSASSRFNTDFDYMEFTNKMDNKNVNIAIPAFLFNRYTEEETTPYNNNNVIKASTEIPLLKTETPKTTTRNKRIQYTLTETKTKSGKIPLYKQVITRYNNDPVNIYTPYKPNPRIMSVITPPSPTAQWVGNVINQALCNMAVKRPAPIRVPLCVS